MAGVASEVRIDILGPLQVRSGPGEPVEVVGPRLRTLLIRLALDLDRVVVVDLAGRRGLGRGPAAGATNALQSLVVHGRVLPSR